MSENPGQLFSDADRERLSRHGIAFDEAVRQLALLRDGARFRDLDRPARIGDGVTRLERRGVPDQLETASLVGAAGRISKFVPASGAATRMFQTLLRALDEFEQGSMSEESRGQIEQFLGEMPRLALRHELARWGFSLDELGRVISDESMGRLAHVLRDERIGLASQPKGLIPFHDAGTRGCTAFEEHLREALVYARDAAGVARAHFTVPDESRSDFEALLEALREPLETSYRGRLAVTFSSQERSTDTISMGEDGAPFRDEQGDLVIRPGGHGALLGNLQNTGGDIVVIKNIDNVVPEHAIREIAHWKKVLIGYLVTLHETVGVYLREIHDASPEAHWLGHGLVLAERQLSIEVPDNVRHGSESAKRDFLASVLDRPIRVCGVVRNEGEPGGGPCWVRQADGRSALQIVESAEVDMTNAEQAAIWRASTHFNPVDLIIGLRDWRGEPFDLERFSDPAAVFRVKKSSGSRPLTALERPGLWNGAMADWITVFVEVPLATFAPVKTIFDLLRPEHR